MTPTSPAAAGITADDGADAGAGPRAGTDARDDAGAHTGSDAGAGTGSDDGTGVRAVPAMALLSLGGGNMAAAMIGGLLRRLPPDVPPATRVVVIEPDEAARGRWSPHPALTVLPSLDALPDGAAVAGAPTVAGPQTVTDPHAAAAPQTVADRHAMAGAARPFDVLLLAVKPQQAERALRDAAPRLAALAARSADFTMLSIAAGLRAGALREWSGMAAVARAMPNTPALIGEGIAGLWLPPDTGPATRARLVALVQATGECVDVPTEDDLDAVTAVSGSGPAYAFYLLEAMIEAGTRQGLPAATARQLAIGTLRGAAQLAGHSDGDVAELRRRVTSPGGTTAAAIAVLDEADVRGAIVRALDAAHRRSRELSGS